MRHPSLRSPAVAAVALLLALGAGPGWAADQCEDERSNAEASYAIGRFAETVAQADLCLGKKPAKLEREAVLAIKAKAQLAMDEVDAATATLELLLRVNPGFEPDMLRDPPRYTRMLLALRQVSTTVTISSLSKTPEALREAPGTVLVLTAEEIRRRGYLDLEALLHDLSGFDISTTAGPTYANIYPRGYRSDETNRLQLLIDGRRGERPVVQ